MREVKKMRTERVIMVRIWEAEIEFGIELTEVDEMVVKK